LGVYMKTVYLYGGKGKYAETGSFEWNSPEVGSTHQFILFLAQASTEPDDQAAIQELASYGFTDLQVAQGKPIAVEVLNESSMYAFQKHYEGALSEGSSLVWYP